MQKIRNYRKLIKQGFSVQKSWELARMPSAFEIFIWGFLAGVILLGLLAPRYTSSAPLTVSVKYARDLEKTLSICLSEKGGPVRIGEDWFLCSIYPLGQFKEK